MSQPTLIGVLIAAVAALASVIVYLWRDGRRERRRIESERRLMLEGRAAWDVEREKIRTEYEAKLRVAVGDYVKQVHDLNAKYVQALHVEHAENRTNEAQIRREFAELIEQISTEAGKHADAIRAVLQKFLERFVGPRR